MDVNVLGPCITDSESQYLKDKAIEYIKLLRFTNYLKSHTLTIKVLKIAYELDSFTCGLYRTPTYKGRKLIVETDHEIVLNHKFLYNKEEILSTLVHELVHLRQYVTGKLKWIRYRRFGVIHVYWNNTKLGLLGLIKEPWEVEAEKIEKRFIEKGLL